MNNPIRKPNPREDPFEMGDPDERNAKMNLLMEIYTLDSKGYRPTRRWTMQDSLFELTRELELLKRNKERNAKEKAERLELEEFASEIKAFLPALSQMPKDDEERKALQIKLFGAGMLGLAIVAKRFKMFEEGCNKQET